MKLKIIYGLLIFAVTPAFAKYDQCMMNNALFPKGFHDWKNCMAITDLSLGTDDSPYVEMAKYCAADENDYVKFMAAEYQNSFNCPNSKYRLQPQFKDIDLGSKLNKIMGSVNRRISRETDSGIVKFHLQSMDLLNYKKVQIYDYISYLVGLGEKYTEIVTYPEAEYKFNDIPNLFDGSGLDESVLKKTKRTLVIKLSQYLKVKYKKHKKSWKMLAYNISDGSTNYQNGVVFYNTDKKVNAIYRIFFTVDP